MRVCVCVCVSVWEYACGSACLCVYMFTRANVRVVAPACVRAHACMCASVYLLMRGVCQRVCVCVCGRV